MRKSKFDAHLRPFLLIIGMALGILREPAFEHALFLEKHLVDAPEAGKGEPANDGGGNLVLDQQGGGYAPKAHYQPNPPGAFAPIIFHFDDSRMANANAQKNGCANDNSAQIHSTNIHFFSGLTV